MGKDDRPIRLRAPVYERVRAAQAAVVQLGWAALGIKSTNTPTIPMVCEEAIALLEAKITAAKRRRR